MYETTIEAFKVRCVHLSHISNNTDLLVYPRIPDSAFPNLRTNFKLHIDEVILYVRDTSFWNSRDQGVVITDWGFNIIVDNDEMDNLAQVPWSDILYVEYNGANLHFFSSENRNDYFSVHISHFLKDLDDENKCIHWGKRLADTFTEMSKTQAKADIETIINERAEEYNKLMKEEKVDEALRLIETFREEHNNVYFTPEQAWLYHKKGHTNRALQVLDDDISALDKENNFWISKLNYSKYSIYEDLNDFKSAREHCQSVIQNTEKLVDSDAEKLFKEATTDFSKYETHYVEQFLDQPYPQRKLVVPVKTYTELNQNHITVLNINHLPSIEFPIGHPIANKLYVGHPYITNKYIPFDNYELEFIEDKIREFCHIMQLLGATEINISCENSSSTNTEHSSNRDVYANIDYKFASAKGDLNQQKSNKIISNIGKNIQLHQKFNPVTITQLPDDLVWFKNEPSWQRLYNQRMQGGLVEHIEKIETKKSQVIEDSQLQSISAEVKWLFLKANGSWDEKHDSLFEAHDHDILALNVKFAPLNTLLKSQEPTTELISEPVSEMSANEKEYFEELQLSYSDDNEISAKERRLLKRLQQTLGITDERAAYLENICKKPQFTQDELEYLEEYKECIEDDGSISSRSRRLLDKLAVTLCIDSERQITIENNYKPIN